MTTMPEDAVSSPFRDFLLLMVIVLAMAELSYDFGLMNVAMPVIAKQMNLPIALAQWTVSAPLLVFGALVVISGRLIDILGFRRSLLGGLAAICIGAATGLLADGIMLLIVGRVLQGAGRAVVNPAALSLITAEFPDGPKRSRALAIMLLVQLTSAPLGLLLAGWMVGHFGWRSVLVFSLVLSVSVVPFTLAAVRRQSVNQEAARHLDLAGAVLSAVMIAAPVFGFGQAVRVGWLRFSSGGAILAGAAALMLFVMVEKRARMPLIQLSLFARVNVASGLLAAVICSGGMAGFLTVLFFGLGTGLHYSPVEMGLALVPFGLAGFAGERMTPLLAKRVRAKTLVLAGMVALAAGDLWLAGLMAHLPYWGTVLPAIVVTGFFTFVGTITAIAEVMRNIPADSRGVGSGLVLAGQQASAATNIAVLMSAVGFALSGGLVRALSVGWIVGAIIVAAATAQVFLRMKPRPVINSDVAVH